jgi:hypothetical protein
MKRIQLSKNAALIFLLVVLCLVFMTACDVRVIDSDDNVANNNFFAVETFSFEIAVKNQTRLNFEAINGPVDVVGVPNAATARIWGERRVESESEADAKAHLKDLEVRLTERQDELSVKTIQPDNSRGRNYKVVYHLRIPNAWKLRLDHVNGMVTIDSLSTPNSLRGKMGDGQGTITLSTVNGNISVNGF